MQPSLISNTMPISMVFNGSLIGGILMVSGPREDWVVINKTRSDSVFRKTPWEVFPITVPLDDEVVIVAAIAPMDFGLRVFCGFN